MGEAITRAPGLAAWMQTIPFHQQQDALGQRGCRGMPARRIPAQRHSGSAEAWGAVGFSKRFRLIKSAITALAAAALSWQPWPRLPTALG